MFFNIKLSKGLSKLIGIDSSKGTLQKGKDADILIIDKDISIRCVFSCGFLEHPDNQRRPVNQHSVHDRDKRHLETAGQQRRRIPPLAGQRRRTGNRNFPQIQGHRTAAVRVPCGRITPRNPQTGIIANTSGSAAISPTA